MDEEIQPPKELRLKAQNKCFIISNRFEGTDHALPNYRVDEDDITKTFSSLNFRVKKKENLPKEKMKKFLRKISDDEDYTQDECVVLFILSHGNDKQEIYSNNIEGNNLEGSEGILVSYIISKLVDIATLRGKPKLVFIQACRGDDFEKAVKILKDKDKDKVMHTASTSIKRAENADTFVFYSSMPDTASMISSAGTEKGSVFIGHLCKVLRAYCNGPEKSCFHLADIVTKVNDLISKDVRDYYDKGSKVDAVQVSQACSSLTQHVYFQPIKEQ